jgi:peptidoglycan/xylan/chitin deacetylase (PgdA/CDA1 family)
MSLNTSSENPVKKKVVFPFFNNDFYFVRTPGWLKMLYPGCVWDIPEKDKTLYLTFDDGPHPVVTPFVLEELEKYNAKATFFCLGENVLRYPDVYQQILDQGHAVGNHTYDHINGWKSNEEEYVENVMMAGKLINSVLFRPPYGRVKRSQIKSLTVQKKMKVIMWNIVAGDWVQTNDAGMCFQNIKKKTVEGDIIVLHDSEKAWKRMSYCLRKILDYYTDRELQFKKIECI